MGDRGQEEKRVYKVVIMGGGGVGKSCLTFQLVHGKFNEKYDPTLEDAYRKDNFEVDGEAISMEILDTAGQDTYRGMRDQYYRNGEGFLMVYSVTDSSSIEDVKERYQSLMESTDTTPETCKPVFFIGNKCDLEDDRVVSKQHGKSIADELSGGTIEHHETSAKNNINVTEVFQGILRAIMKEESETKEIKKKKKRTCTIF